jgi:hypothetical protein
MGYTSKRSGRPNEFASRSSHTNIIKDETVASFLDSCNLPEYSDTIELVTANLEQVPELKDNPVKYIIAIDGGYTEIPVRDAFPSSKVAFFQIGALMFGLQALDEIHDKAFIDPKDMGKLQEIQRFKFTLPTKNVTLNGEADFKSSVRRTIANYFLKNPEDKKLVDTLKWFLFEEYAGTPQAEYSLASCPYDDCDKRDIRLLRQSISKDFDFSCPQCGKKIYLTDVFRLHEVVDNELGASGILGYTTTLLEQMILVHIIRLIMDSNPSMLNEVLFIKDGPLAFFGQTANMHKLMRKLVNYLFDKHNLYLVGLEKSGEFVEHADQVAGKIASGEALCLTDEYIYKYIKPGLPDPSKAYGSTTYYSGKVIFKSRDDRVYVAMMPNRKPNANSTLADFPNAAALLGNIEKLKCDMYDSSLVPVALVNKLVSLSNHPSATLLEKFAKSKVA